MASGQGPASAQRRRTAITRGTTPGRFDVSTDAIDAPDWIFATGGSYFFAPAKSAIELLSAGATDALPAE